MPLSHIINTHSGRRFDVLNPNPDDVTIKDVAWGLSRRPVLTPQIEMNIYNAQFNVLCSRNVPSRFQVASMLASSWSAYTDDDDYAGPIACAVAARFGVPVRDIVSPQVYLAVLTTYRDIALATGDAAYIENFLDQIEEFTEDHPGFAAPEPPADIADIVRPMDHIASYHCYGKLLAEMTGERFE